MKPDLSHRFRQQAVSLVLFFAAVAAVFALAGLSKDPAKKQAEFVVQQLLSCSSAVEQAVDAAVPSGSQPGLTTVDTQGLYTYVQAQLGDVMTADCLDQVLANRLPTRITALAGQSGDKLEPASLTLKSVPVLAAAMIFLLNCRPWPTRPRQPRYPAPSPW